MLGKNVEGGKFDQRLILDRDVQNMIAKFYYCKEMNQAPYYRDYGETPAGWIDFCQIMIGEMAKCEAESRRRHG